MSLQLALVDIDGKIAYIDDETFMVKHYCNCGSEPCMNIELVYGHSLKTVVHYLNYLIQYNITNKHCYYNNDMEYVEEYTKMKKWCQDYMSKDIPTNMFWRFLLNSEHKKSKYKVNGYESDGITSGTEVDDMYIDRIEPVDEFEVCI